MTNAEIVQYLADGNTIQEIATKCGQDKYSLEYRVKVLKKKFICATYAHLVANFMRKKLID